VHSEKRLTLVFEFMDLDLKKLIDLSAPMNGMDPYEIKVCLVF
jgi:hypothetical protein